GGHEAAGFLGPLSQIGVHRPGVHAHGGRREWPRGGAWQALGLRRGGGGVGVSLLLVLASCGDDDDGDRSAPTTEGSTTSASEETTTTAQELPLDQIDVKLTQVAEADTPTSLVTRPGSDTLYVSERAGRGRPMTLDLHLGAPA